MPSPGGPAAVTWGQPAGALHLFILLHKMPEQLTPNHHGPSLNQHLPRRGRASRPPSRSAQGWVLCLGFFLILESKLII